MFIRLRQPNTVYRFFYLSSSLEMSHDIQMITCIVMKEWLRYTVKFCTVQYREFSQVLGAKESVVTGQNFECRGPYRPFLLHPFMVLIFLNW